MSLSFLSALIPPLSLPSSFSVTSPTQRGQRFWGSSHITQRRRRHPAITLTNPITQKDQMAQNNSVMPIQHSCLKPPWQLWQGTTLFAPKDHSPVKYSSFSSWGCHQYKSKTCFGPVSEVCLFLRHLLFKPVKFPNGN